jgi:hypothetical protein
MRKTKIKTAALIFRSPLSGVSSKLDDALRELIDRKRASNSTRERSDYDYERERERER